MTIVCPKCSARYNIQDSLIPNQGARVKCKKCETVITIPPPVVELAPQDLELIPPPAPPAPAPSPRAASARRAPPASGAADTPSRRRRRAGAAGCGLRRVRGGRNAPPRGPLRGRSSEAREGAPPRPRPRVRHRDLQPREAGPGHPGGEPRGHAR